MKRCTKLRLVYKRYSIVLQGHLSNSNDTWVKEITDVVPISMFLENPSSNPNTEMRNKTLMGIDRGHASLFCMVIVKFSMPHRPNKFGRPVAAFKSLRFSLFYSAYANDLW